MNIIPFNALQADATPTLQIANDAEIAELAAQNAFAGIERIELNFPKFTDGRAYSQALLLRRRREQRPGEGRGIGRARFQGGRRASRLGHTPARPGA